MTVSMVMRQKFLFKDSGSCALCEHLRMGISPESMIGECEKGVFQDELYRDVQFKTCDLFKEVSK